MAISLGPVEFDEALIKKQLRRDLLDDWFPDPRRFEDMLDAGHVEAVLDENFKKNNGAFRPEPRTLLNIPKSNYTLRYGLETSLVERLLYQALVSRLVPFYDPLVPWNVFSHRASDHPNRYLFRRAIPAWQDFTGVVRSTLESGGRVLLSTDLTNYFENIDLERLRKTLLDLLPELEAYPAEKADIRVHITMLFDCLKSWCYSSTSGLPQNRDASSFLANIYMLPVDRVMLAKGHRYFRYMDDIKVVCGSPHEARLILKELSLELRERGLSVNSGKTAIIRIEETEKIAASVDAGDPELQQINAIWQTRSLRPISRSFPLLGELTQRLLNNGEVGSRAFRFCIRRLEALASCPEFAVPDNYFAPITPLVIAALSDHPSSTDELSRYLRAVPTTDTHLEQIAGLLMDAGRNFYTWQNYRLWVLLVQKAYKNAELLAFAMRVVSEKPDSATRTGATLYAGAFGGKDDRIAIARGFNQVKSFMGQRAALLAVQELHFKPYVRDFIAPSLREDLKNVYRGLDRKGIYVAPPEPFSITKVLDTERDYD